MYEVSKCAPQKALRDLDQAFENFFRRVKKGGEAGLPPMHIQEFVYVTLILAGNHPPMELRQIRSYLAVSEDLHFRRAAERLSLAQPAVSKHINLLEKELGVRLFHRDRQDVQLSPEGLLFRERAREILASMQEASAAMRPASQSAMNPPQVGEVTNTQGWRRSRLNSGVWSA